MKKKYDSNENLIFTRGDVRYNSKKKKLTSNGKNREVADYIDEVNYIYSLDDDAIHNEFRGSFNIENIW